jgi:hypothetical protein
MSSLDLINQFIPRLQKAPLVQEDRSDARLTAIVSLVEKGQFSEVKKLSEELFDEELFDIRVVMYFLFSTVLEKGIHEMKEILDLFPLLFRDHLEQLRPLKNRDTQCNRSLNWFFNHLIRTLKRAQQTVQEKAVHPFWEKSLHEASFEKIDELLETLLKMDETLARTCLDLSALTEHFSYLISMLKELKKQLPVQNDVTEIFEEEKREEEVVEEKESIEEQTAPLNQVEPPSEIRESSLMKELLKKFEVFEELIEKEEFFKAAIVSHDISEAIEHFDPVKYFPRFFSRYFSLQAQYNTVLAEKSEQQDSSIWNALNKLYNVDIEEFNKVEYSN